MLIMFGNYCHLIGWTLWLHLYQYFRRKNNLKLESGSTESSEICEKKIEGIDGEKVIALFTSNN